MKRLVRPGLAALLLALVPLTACSAVDDGARVRDDAPHADSSPGPAEAPGRDPRPATSSDASP